MKRPAAAGEAMPDGNSAADGAAEPMWTDRKKPSTKPKAPTGGHGDVAWYRGWKIVISETKSSFQVFKTRGTPIHKLYKWDLQGRKGAWAKILNDRDES